MHDVSAARDRARDLVVTRDGSRLDDALRKIEVDPDAALRVLGEEFDDLELPAGEWRIDGDGIPILVDERGVTVLTPRTLALALAMKALVIGWEMGGGAARCARLSWGAGSS